MNENLAQSVSAGKIPAALAEKLNTLTPGTYCVHNSWGAGVVASWELALEKLIIDFEGKTGHEMKLEFAAKSIYPLPSDHILARRVADRDGLATMAKSDPMSLVKLVLISHGGSMSLDKFDEVVKGKIVADGMYKNWWDNAKKVLRTNKSFVVPSKRTLPLEFRGDDLNPQEAMVGDFLSAKDLKAKIKATESIITNVGTFSDPVGALGDVVTGLDDAAAKALRLQPTTAFELLLVRDELLTQSVPLREKVPLTQTLEQFLKQGKNVVTDVLKGLSANRQKQLLAIFPLAYGDEWFTVTTACLGESTGRTVNEIARFIMDQGKEEDLTIFLQKGLQNRSLSNDLLQWICKERKGAAFELFDADFVPPLVNALERELYDDSVKKSGRLRDVVVDDRDLLGDLTQQLDDSQAKSLARRLMGSPVFDDLTRRSLLARMIKVQPDLQNLIEHPEDDGDGSDEVLIVSEKSLRDRQAAYERLIKEEIPKNTKDIAIARSYGDLRENFEFKSAKEQQRVLARRQKTMERELSKARISDFKEAPTNVVSIGTVVGFTDATVGKTESMTILGAWDTDTDNNILSYLSGMAKSLLGKAVGDRCQIPSDQGGSRSVTITSISRYVS